VEEDGRCRTIVYDYSITLTKRGKEGNTVELGIVVESGPDADEDSVMHSAHPVRHYHAFLTTQDELFPISSCNFGINGLGEGQRDKGTLFWTRFYLCGTVP